MDKKARNQSSNIDKAFVCMAKRRHDAIPGAQSHIGPDTNGFLIKIGRRRGQQTSTGHYCLRDGGCEQGRTMHAYIYAEVSCFAHSMLLRF